MNLDDLSEEELAELAYNGTDEEMRAVAMHPNASLNTLLLLAEKGFAQDVDQNPLMLLHVEVGSDEVIQILSQVAVSTQREERMQELASSIWADVRRGISNNPNTLPAILTSLAKDEDAEVRQAVATNEYTPKNILTILSKDPNAEVRNAVGCNRRTPARVLTLLSKDPEAEVRRGVSSNEKIPPNALEDLSKDWDMEVAIGVAGNPNTPTYMLARLSVHRELSVRCGVATNKKTPRHILEILTKDVKYVSQLARNTLAKLRKARK